MSVATADFDYIRALVREGSAMQLDRTKEYLVEARLLPVARDCGQASVEELVRRLRTTPVGPLHARVIEAMTINETSFFRDASPFTALATHVIPELMDSRRAERSLSIWSAACSSGQEIYSIAMIVDELLANDPGWRVRLLATDVSAEMVERTRRGAFSQLEVNRGLPAHRLVRNFTRAGTDWQVSERLRRMVEARVHNLAGPWAIPPMDVVFLRNVLIYFDTDTKRRILARVRTVLRPDGYLFLGGAETTLNLDDGFERVQIDRATAYRLRGGKA